MENKNESNIREESKNAILMVLQTLSDCTNCDSCKLLSTQCLVMITENLIDLERLLR